MYIHDVFLAKTQKTQKHIMYMTGTLLPVSNNKHCLTWLLLRNFESADFFISFLLDTIFS